MTGYHARWVRPPEQAEDPERIAIREALAFGKAVYLTSAAPLPMRMPTALPNPGLDS